MANHVDPADFFPQECDIVMQGGVTSGVVYPSFVARLAERFTLRSIGGSSVGAVAAIGAAAAQFRRNRVGRGDAADIGFARLDEVPAWLGIMHGGRSNLLSLFQPCEALARHYRVLEAALNPASMPAAMRSVVWQLLRQFRLGALAGAVGWSILLWISYRLITGIWPVSVPGRLVATAWFCLGGLIVMVAGSLAEAVWSGWKGLRDNKIGLCSGLRQSPQDGPGLTEWLHALAQDVAGLAPDQPLTFGQLKASTPSIELALTTTGLSELRAHRLPHVSADLVFRRSEWQALFPAAIINWLVSHSSTGHHRHETIELLRQRDPGFGGPNQDYFFMPAADDLPILVAARLSLSFPLLLQAVPLFRLRYQDESDQQAAGVALARTWFSDGGLTSNFPIHFFDALLPTRPTFGVTLEGNLPAGAPPSARISLPATNSEGITAAYLAIDGLDGRPSPLAAAGALLRTIRTWRDEALKRTPGFRDRVVQIRHTRREGGLNLNMPAEAIALLSASGRAAADAIIARFLAPAPEQNGWLNHRWVRMRSSAALLQQALVPVDATLESRKLVPSYAEMWANPGSSAQGAYPLTIAQRSAGIEMWQALAAAASQAHSVDLAARAPKPQPTLAITPSEQ
jgi:predicted acylesterase/phospholipase RssA